MPARGFTLLECLVVVAIVCILLAAGLPITSDYMKNQRMRGVAEQVRDGLSLARLEAIRRNTTVNFVPNGSGWSVVVPASGTTAAITITTRSPYNDDGSITVSPSATQAGFNGSGRLSSASSYSVGLADSTLTCAASGGTGRCLNVNVARGGDIRMCDPAQASTAPEGC